LKIETPIGMLRPDKVFVPEHPAYLYPKLMLVTV